MKPLFSEFIQIDKQAFLCHQWKSIHFFNFPVGRFWYSNKHVERMVPPCMTYSNLSSGQNREIHQKGKSPHLFWKRFECIVFTLVINNLVWPIFGAFFKTVSRSDTIRDGKTEATHIYVCVSCLNLLIQCVSGWHTKCRILEMKSEANSVVVDMASHEGNGFCTVCKE